MSDLRVMKLPELRRECTSLKSKVCWGFCDQLSGYHQDECRSLLYVINGQEQRVTYIRRLAARVRQRLAASGVKV